MAAFGSLEYVLTWKHWATESGSPICALLASGRRTSVSVCIGSQTSPIEGWPKTPMSSDGDGDGGVMEIRPGADGKYKLRDYAQLAGWATATKTTQSGDLTNQDGTPWDGTSKPYQNGKPVTTALGDQVKLVGWKTAMANDSIRRGNVEPSEKSLNNAAALAGWATAKVTDTHGSKPHGQGGQGLHTMAQMALGPITALFLVPTGKRVVLAPEFSLWLMGFPEAWAKAAPLSENWRAAQAALELECSKDRETPSSPSLPPSSSALSST